ncbi:MAG: hypothetical protein DRK00_04700 [Thermoprotei archaeon]|nr:MAG: hypothetical protein DRK00_04700 [Thermoprotei archaeon]
MAHTTDSYVSEKLNWEVLKKCKGMWLSIPGEAVNVLEVPVKEGELLEGEEVYSQIARLIADMIGRRGKCLAAFDGMVGVEFSELLSKVGNELEEMGVSTSLVNFSYCFKEPEEIKEILRPYLEVDPEWGRVYRRPPKSLLNLEEVDRLAKSYAEFKREASNEALICYGPLSTIPPLRRMYDLIFYVDMTVEELYNRMRSGKVHALGSRPESPMYLDIKRFFYVDYVIVKKHRRYILRYIDWYLLEEGRGSYKMVSAPLFERICNELIKGPFRAKPFYIPGVWGGEWLKELKPALKKLLPSPDVPLSWEIDVVDNVQSVRVKVGGVLLEIPLITILWKKGREILGDYVYKRYHGRLPLTMNYDDTYNAGPLAKGEGLAIQVHPHRSYLKKVFNENFSHHESYYILDVGPGAKTYQGLKEDADIEQFYKDVIRALKQGIPFDHNKYVNSFPSRRGQLFLNPAGTIHASGYNQVVLEPDLIPLEFPGYIFHFYDYLRKDLDGKPRSIHPKHAFSVLKRHYRTSYVTKYLQPKPKLVRAGEGWREYVIGECREAEYVMCILEFEKRIEDSTHGTVQLLTLVDGWKALIKPKGGGREFKIGFGETVIMPACVGSYEIVCLCDKGVTPAGTPLGPGCKVLKFFVRRAGRVRRSSNVLTPQ